MLLLPVVMQFCFLWGIFFFGTVFTATFALLVASGDFGAFMEAVMYIPTLFQAVVMGVTDLPAAPASYASVEALRQTVFAGILTPQALGVALIIALFLGLALMATAYTKALVLGILTDGLEGRRSSVIDMFRKARQYWVPVMRYYVPYAVLALIGILVIIPLIVITLASSIILQADPPADPSYFIIIGLIIAFLVFRFFTLYAEATIVNGSRRPVTDSAAYTRANTRKVFFTAVILVVVALAMFALNALLSILEEQSVEFVAFLASVVSTMLFVVWRLWVSSYVLSLGYLRNQAQQKLRVE
jgi:hypothetical protein